MACFLVPAAEAVITTIAAKAIRKREEKNGTNKDRTRISGNISRLSKFLWSGTGLLAFEHICSGELVPYYPFFTSYDSISGMLREMAFQGTAIAAVITVFWAAVCIMSGRSRTVQQR